MEPTNQPDPNHDRPSLANLTVPQAKVALAIASGTCIIDAAKQAGVHRSTVYQWMRSDPAFPVAVEEARRDYVSRLRDWMRSISIKALERIEGLIDDPNTPPSVALRAALAVLERHNRSEQGWSLPEPATLPAPERVEEDQQNQSLAPESDTIRHNPPETVTSRPISRTDRRPTPRNAPCPCGSGKKYKRCCGVSAPPVYHEAA